jgi:proteasome activator subunit 4
MRKRMTGVLGLTALVHAFPYTVPFPDAVVAISKRVNDPGPVGPRAKKAVQTFKHTHTDSWKEAKKCFTHEELEDLNDSSFSGSHS